MINPIRFSLTPHPIKFTANAPAEPVLDPSKTEPPAAETTPPPMPAPLKWLGIALLSIPFVLPAGIIGYDAGYRMPRMNSKAMEIAKRDWERAEKEMTEWLEPQYEKDKADGCDELFLEYFHQKLPRDLTRHHYEFDQDNRYALDGGSRWVVRKLPSLKSDHAKVRVLLNMITSSKYRKTQPEAVQVILLKEEALSAIQDPQLRDSVKTLIELKEKTLSTKDYYPQTVGSPSYPYSTRERAEADSQFETLHHQLRQLTKKFK